jgi:hypothetical protein
MQFDRSVHSLIAWLRHLCFCRRPFTWIVPDMAMFRSMHDRFFRARCAACGYSKRMTGAEIQMLKEQAQ